jgi:hypothetical protein
MRKHFTKILCVVTAVVSACSIGFLSACSDYKSEGVESDKTVSSLTSNGGFLVETGDYVYFVNGKANYTDTNKYGDVVKGSIQRISKKDLSNHNYSSTETIVPLVVYSGSTDSGIYIYGDYIYYATPSTQKNSDGEVQNSYLEFKRSKLDGSSTMRSYYYQAADNTLDYRYVEVNNTVYLVYAVDETLYSDETTNIHSVNTETGVDTLLAYNVSSYMFDSDDLENPNVYYTMAVTNYLGSSNSISESYNQIYRVNASATEIENRYDFSNITDYDADEDPLYINNGDFVLDGIGIIENGNLSERITQFNFHYGSDTKYSIAYHDLTYTMTSYTEGKLTFTIAETVGDTSSKGVYSLTDSQIDANNDGKVDASWDAINANLASSESSTISLELNVADSNTYEYVKINGADKVIYVDSNGINVGELVNGKLANEYIITDASSAEIIAIRSEQTLKAGSTTETETHLYAYYSGTKNSTSGYYRIAIDGNKDDYERNKLPYADNWTYKDVRILDIAVASSWFTPEFVDGQIIFASDTEGMSSYNYIMACDLRNSSGYIMSNAELNDYNEQYAAVTETIEAYDDDDNVNSDGTAAYENLSNALKYLFYSRDDGYLKELIDAYVEIQSQDEEYLYSKRSAEIYLEFANATGDWASYSTDYAVKTVNGESVYANSQAYYYTILGQVSEDDQDAILDSLKSSYMKDYPDDTRTFWEKMSTLEKVLFVVGVSVAGLLVIAGITVLVIFIVKRIKRKKNEKVEEKVNKIDITDDKSIDVYGTDEVVDEASHTAKLDD